MKFATERPYADPEKTARKLVEIANAVEAVQDGPPTPRTMIAPIRPPDMNNSEREEIRQKRVSNFKAHQERFTREREDFAASQMKRMLERS